MSYQSVTRIAYAAIMLIWLFSAGPAFAFTNFVANSHIAFMMFFGSFVAGGTALGGGAVAFPVLTKLIGIPVVNAKMFSLAIQSFGMSAASLTILRKKIAFYPYIVLAGTLGSLLGVTISLSFLNNVIPDLYVKLGFSTFLLLFALTMARIQLFQNGKAAGTFTPHLSAQQYGLLVATGFIGGLISGQMGSGSDFIVFALIVLVLNGDLIAATATSVFVMALTSIFASCLNFYLRHDLFMDIVPYVHAAIPIVIIGAPLGAWICLKVHVRYVLATLFLLITLECISTLITVLTH